MATSDDLMWWVRPEGRRHTSTLAFLRSAPRPIAQLSLLQQVPDRKEEEMGGGSGDRHGSRLTRLLLPTEGAERKEHKDGEEEQDETLAGAGTCFSSCHGQRLAVLERLAPWTRIRVRKTAVFFLECSCQQSDVAQL